ncbi:MAG: TIGR03809 family protein [Xanthobacteraceae bacterium]|nr:MAG: TIGR03809 family protein [Xanthobacteraceae bacterium]
MIDRPEMTRGRDVAMRWRALAERRLEALDELYRSGRWQRYYREPEFTALMRDAIAAVEAWRQIAPDTADATSIAPVADAGPPPLSVPLQAFESE